MLKPSGGFFKKLFSPERMAKMRKPGMQAAPRPAAPAPAPARRMNRERTGGVLGRAVARKAY